MPFETTFGSMHRASTLIQFTSLQPQPGVPPTPAIQWQDGWQRCQKCQGLFYGATWAVDQSACPAGDKHDGTSSNDYLMPFGDCGSDMETGWRWCQKCDGLFFGLRAVQGACPRGGQHDGSKSLAYDMARLGVTGIETSWKWCAKCEGLFYSGNPEDQGACPTGGKHDGTQSPYVMKLGALPQAPVRKLKPQLFLVETYQISTFKGRLIRGDNVGTLPSMLPHSHLTSKLITKKMDSTDIAKSSTVLDDQTAQSNESFNQHLQKLSDTKSSSEHYDYGLQANAHAEGSIGFGSASGDAHVDVAGSTDDARHEIGQSVGQAIDSQVGQANQVRKQQVTVGDEKTETKTETETEVIIERTNDSDQVSNLGIFQLKQELVTILTLIDVHVAFRNTDPKNDKQVKLFELDSLLKDVIATDKEASIIKSQIRTVLENIRDYMDEPKSILARDATRPDTLVINKRLAATYELKNADGTTGKVISAPGIIVNAYPPRYIFQPGSYITLPLT